MIRDLDNTIEELLTSNWPSDTIFISFETPYDTTFSEPTINLFLYDIRENLEMRSTEWLALPIPDSPPKSPPSPPGQVRRRRPRVQVDCSYIITAWTSGADIKSEHHLLSTAIDILLKNRRFPESVLKGDLANGGKTLVYRTLSLQTDYLSMGEYWQAMQGKPKVAFNYQVTLSTDISDDADTVRVVEEVVSYVKKKRVIKGLVLNSVSEPYPNVNVFQRVMNPVTKTEEFELRCTSNENGQYVGGGFISGVHTIRYEDRSNPSIWTQRDIDIPPDGKQPFIVDDVEL